MNTLMDVHTGDIGALFRSVHDDGYFDDAGEWNWIDFGPIIKAPYCALLCAATVLMFISGVAMWQHPGLALKNRNALRRRHHIVSFVAGGWLLFASSTGGIWAMLRWWTGDATEHADMVQLFKQLHVGYFAPVGLWSRATMMAGWSILGGSCLGLALVATGIWLSTSLNIVGTFRKIQIKYQAQRRQRGAVARDRQKKD